MKTMILAFLKNKSIFNQKHKMVTSFGNKEKKWFWLWNPSGYQVSFLVNRTEFWGSFYRDRSEAGWAEISVL